MSEAMKLAPILRGMCEGGGEEEGVDIYAADYSPGDGDVFVMRAAQLLEKLAAEVTNLRAQTSTARGWLQYYADGAHFIRHNETAWETVSGEPENFQEDEACTATVEDGSMAKLALMQMDGFVKGIPKPGEFHKLYAEWQAQQMSGIVAAPAQPETWKVLPSPTRVTGEMLHQAFPEAPGETWPLPAARQAVWERFAERVNARIAASTGELKQEAKE